MSRPETFQDWRSLWHQLARDLGQCVCLNIQAGRPAMTRDTWQLYDQMRWVFLRMEMEREAMTPSYCRAIMEVLREDDDGDDGGEFDPVNDGGLFT